MSQIHEKQDQLWARTELEDEEHNTVQDMIEAGLNTNYDSRKSMLENRSKYKRIFDKS